MATKFSNAGIFFLENEQSNTFSKVHVKMQIKANGSFCHEQCSGQVSVTSRADKIEWKQRQTWHHNKTRANNFTKLNRYFIWQYNSLCIRLNWNEKNGSDREIRSCLATLDKPVQPIYRLSRRNRTNEDKGPRRSGAEAEDRKRHLRGTIFLAAQEAFEVNIHGDTLSSLHGCKIHAKSRKD